jgi:hypothetical protein
MSKIAIDLQGTDNASRAMQAASQHLAKLNAEIDKVKAAGTVELSVGDSRKLASLTREAERMETRLRSANREMTAAQPAAGGLASALGPLGPAFSAAAVGAAAFKAVDIVADLGEIGAQSLDTVQAFDSVRRSVGATPELLNRLKQAAGGTISEMRLMQLTNTALAGSSGEMGQAFADAVPKLIEGARAANKLNPALGDTEFPSRAWSPASSAARRC